MPQSSAGKEEEATNKENKSAESIDRKDFDKMVKNVYYQKGYASNPS